MKQNILLLTLIVIGVIILAGCQGGSTASAAVEAAEAAVTTPSSVVEELVLITSTTGQVKRIGRASLTEGFSMAGPNEMLPYEIHHALDRKDQGYSKVGLYEMETLLNGDVAINLKSEEGCNVPLDATDAVNEKAAATSHTVSLEPVLIVSAEHMRRIGRASLTEGFSMAGPHEMLPYEVHHAFDRKEQGYSRVGLYEAWNLPNGDVAINLKNNKGLAKC